MDLKTGKKCVAVDLDGTLIEYHGFKGDDCFGAFVPSVLKAVKRFQSDGWEVSIFTARVSEDGDKGAYAAHEIRKKLSTVGLGHLEITSTKKKKFDLFLDDRAVSVEKNTGCMIVFPSLKRKLCLGGLNEK